MTVLPVHSFSLLPTTKEKVAALYGWRNNPLESIKDRAGVFSGVKDNEEVALEMLKHPRWKDRQPPLLGVTFYNKANELKICLKTGEDKFEVKDFDPEHPLVPREAFISFWDQMRTTGSNIKHASEASGMETVGDDEGSKDHDQSVWRFRELDKSQRIEYVMAGKVASVIRQRLPEAEGRDLDYKDVLLFTELNQARIRGQQSIQAYSQKLRALDQSLSIQALREESVSEEDLKSVWKELANPFYDETLRGDYQYFPLAKNGDKRRVSWRFA